MENQQKILYHGSQTPDLKILKPNPHNAVNKRAVVFATSDIRFALAMMYGTGDELAVGYFVNTNTHEEEMYIDELQPDKLKLLESPGYLYEVSAEGFYQDPALSHVELVKDTEAKVIKMTKLENTLEELKKYKISIVKYEDVPVAMKQRGKEPGKPKNPYASDRFKDVEQNVTTKQKRDWQEYYEITKNKPPTKLLIKALENVAAKNKAIDIGGGALKDTRYLLEQGFDVTVVDKADLMAKEAEAIKSDKLHYFVSSFADFDFPKSEYDIASAMYSLPFNPPDSFDAVFTRIKESLVNGGIFCGQCFGVRDEWSTNQKMTFHTKEQVEKLLSDMEVILLDEEEKDDRTANGTPKHWHIFHFIAKKL